MDILTPLKVEKVIYGGQGLARSEGQIIFIPFTIDQEQVIVKLIQKKKNYSEAEVLRIIEPSPHRVKPVCSHFGHCGGCQFQHMDYQKQLETKKTILAENLNRFINQVDVLGLPNHCWHYREHIKLSYQEGTLGYHGFKNKNIFSLKECPIFSDKLSEALTALKNALLNAECSPCSVRLLKAGKSFVVAIDSDQPTNIELAPLLNHFQGICLKQEGVITQKGTCTLTQTYLGYLFQMDPWSFIQAHQKMAERLYQHIIDQIPPSTKTLLDLYCGAGILSILAAKKQKLHVYGIELNPRAIEQAHRNQEMHNLPHIKFIAAPAEKALKYVKEPIDFVIVNPPREGLSACMLEELLKMKKASFCYVSCNPTTLQRDLKAFILAGYRVAYACGFDLFPQTTHLETICIIKKGDDFQSSP